QPVQDKRPQDNRSQNRPSDKISNRPDEEQARRKAAEEKARRAKAAEEAKAKQIEKENAKMAKQAARAKRRSVAGKSAESRAVRNGFLAAIMVVLAVFVLVFIVHHLYNYIAEKPNFSFVMAGSVEHTIGAKALIVRDENVINASVSGDLVTQITEGSRVAKQQRLAMVVPSNLESVVSDLRNVQQQISDVQRELVQRGEVSEAESIYDSYDDKLVSVIDNIRSGAMNGNLSDLAAYYASLSVVLDEREDELAKINFDDERLNVLRRDEAVYENQLDREASKILATRPGVVSFRLDGNEETLKYDTFLGLEINEVKKMISSAQGPISSSLYVEADRPVARIAQNDEQYLAVYLNSENAAASDFAIGTEHDINIRSEGVAIEDCEVVRAEEDKNGTLIVFRTTRYVENLLDLRSVDIEIVITEYSGMRVSMTSLVEPYIIDSDKQVFSCYFDNKSGLNPDMFTKENIFNLSALPMRNTDDDGKEVTPSSISVAGCEVFHAETMPDGGTIVFFGTYDENLPEFLRVNSKYTDAVSGGYKLTLIDTTTGLGTDVSNVIPLKCSGIADLYYNNQGFVDTLRVIVIDSDREFAIITAYGNQKKPDYNTVYVTNPDSCKPNDKVG
ncbi:MAG: hypothetical protein J5657_02390, partial [Clostridiales bacterium]|nr:hypothetical protein [Clostridiales bacterium]